MVNQRVYMDITIDGKSSRRIIIELFANATPKFRVLCTGEKGKRLHYKGTSIHRISDSLCKGGEIGDSAKRQLESIYGVNHEPDNKSNCTSEWVVTFGGSSFYISGTAMTLNGVVGQVVDGDHVVEDILKLRRRLTPIVIADCGQLSNRVVSPIAGSQKTSTTKLEQVISVSNQLFSSSLKGFRDVNKQLTAFDSKNVLVSENENELADLADVLEENIGILSDVKAEACSLEKCQNELLSETRTKINNIKNRKFILEAIASLPNEDILNIENAIKKRKGGSQ